MLPPLQIAPAGPENLPDLLALYRHLVPDDPPLAPAEAAPILDRFLLYPGSAIMIGRCNGQAVASCALIVVPNLTRGGAPFGLIENVVTHADFRNRGFGRQVLEAATEAAWAQGCYKIMLMTGSKRPETLEFYRGCGFEQSKTGFQKRRIAARAEAPPR